MLQLKVRVSFTQMNYFSLMIFPFYILDTLIKNRFKFWNYLSSKKIGSQWVCVFVCLFPNSFETTKPDELKFWGMIFLGIRKDLD